MKKVKKKTIFVSIVCSEESLWSSIYGLKEMFLLSNDIMEAEKQNTVFSVQLINIKDDKYKAQKNNNTNAQHIIIIPPALNLDCYLVLNKKLTLWLINQYKNGAVLCSACSGIFVLAATGLLKNRIVTTHWNLKDRLAQVYPELKVNTDQILINHNDLVTAGGVMSWIDLGLELVAQFTHPAIMQQLGKRLVINTGSREQKYYQRFSPMFSHGDEVILKVQQYMQTNLNKTLELQQLAKLAFLTERTFLRRFVKATNITPIKYLQKLRIQKSCDLLELTRTTVDKIAYQVGYEDANAFRRVFIKQVGLTPAAFRERFMRHSH